MKPQTELLQRPDNPLYFSSEDDANKFVGNQAHYNSSSNQQHFETPCVDRRFIDCFGRFFVFHIRYRIFRKIKPLRRGGLG